MIFFWGDNVQVLYQENQPSLESLEFNNILPQGRRGWVAKFRCDLVIIQKDF